LERLTPPATASIYAVADQTDADNKSTSLVPTS
jgi:hypothetical protein